MVLSLTVILNQTKLTDKGGAIYLRGKDLHLDNLTFDGNNATKGSAIFLTKSSEIYISNTIFGQNRADGVDIRIEADNNNTYAYANVTVNVTLVGNDNIANAIWNDGTKDHVTLYNITLEFSKDGIGRPSKVFNDERPDNPKDKYEEDGDHRYLWQSDNEDAQLIDIIIRNPKGEVIYNLTDGVVHVSQSTAPGTEEV